MSERDYRESFGRFIARYDNCADLEEWLGDAISFMNDDEWARFGDSIKAGSKDVRTAWTLWALAGIFGAHRFYLNDRKTGFVFLFTLGFVGFGLLYDLIIYGQKLREFNVKIEAEAARAILSDRLPKDDGGVNA